MLKSPQGELLLISEGGDASEALFKNTLNKSAGEQKRKTQRVSECPGSLKQQSPGGSAERRSGRMKPQPNDEGSEMQKPTTLETKSRTRGDQKRNADKSSRRIPKDAEVGAAAVAQLQPLEQAKKT